MSEKRGILARIFGPKETGCCGVEFEKPAEETLAPQSTPVPIQQSTSCCGSAKQKAGQEP